MSETTIQFQILGKRPSLLPSRVVVSSVSTESSLLVQGIMCTATIHRGWT